MVCPVCLYLYLFLYLYVYVNLYLSTHLHDLTILKVTRDTNSIFLCVGVGPICLLSSLLLCLSAIIHIKLLFVLCSFLSSNLLYFLPSFLPSLLFLRFFLSFFVLTLSTWLILFPGVFVVSWCVRCFLVRSFLSVCVCSCVCRVACNSRVSVEERLLCRLFVAVLRELKT